MSRPGAFTKLSPDNVRQLENGFQLSDTIILLKSLDDWYGQPTSELNARITFEVANAYETERRLRERGVTISHPVAVYDQSPVGGFLDSEGNKLWFCSNG